MIELFKWRGGALLFPLLILLQLHFNVIASEQINIQQKEIDVVAVGKLVQDKMTNEFYFVFTDNSQEKAYPIAIKNRKTFEQLKKLNNKWVRVTGHKKWTKEILIERPVSLWKFEIEQLQEFQLAELKVLKINDQSKIAEIDFRVIDGDKKERHGPTGIPIGDEAANGIIAGAGVIMGIAVGPMSLIPAGIFGLKTLFLDD